ncbi:hypothetical protein [Runella zeae]|uniref:hypothetical protein n=1 Tax=Runella zeae TaxID=94255 RepID=UPI0003FAD8D3|nr:hypothetical protein [Runella zeae]
MAKLSDYNKKVTLDDKIEELEYEVKMREKVFPEWGSGLAPKKKPETLSKRLAVMKAILEDYKRTRNLKGEQSTLNF